MLNQFKSSDPSQQNERFTVPAPDRVENPAVLIEVGVLNNWLDSLPNANEKHITQQITKAITLLNRYSGKLNNRLELIECYRPYITRLGYTQTHSYNALEHELLRRLMTEATYGYKHVINQQLQQRSWLTGRKKLLTGIYFATKFLSLELRLAYEQYDAKIANSWREVMRIYTLTERQNIQNESIDDNTQSNAKNATINHQLKHILLLSLLDPGHLQPNEARTCFDYLDQYASLASLESITEHSNPTGKFILDLTSTQPPQQFEHFKGQLNPEQHRLFNVVPVSRKIQEDIHAIHQHEEELPTALRHHLRSDAINILKRILKAWHIRQERQNERKEAYGWVNISIGISSIHHFLLQGEEEKSAADFTSPPDLDDSLVLGLEMHQRAPIKINYEELRCRQFNRSEGGLALHLPLPISTEPKVGQLILIRQETEEKTAGGQLAVIRRCMRQSSDTLEIGVQFIPGRVKTVTIRPVTAAHTNTTQQPAIVINNGLNRPASMLVSKGLYASTRQYVVTEKWPAAQVAADRLIESTPGFDWFHLSTDAE
ncbi:MAG: PilZ domain-containing protein [Candidatus Polarisedimenticolaceae bacterium]|nr:PilZ domain-containing protein [Candidatus Polarisedimenticolaceae bacterium]